LPTPKWCILHKCWEIISRHFSQVIQESCIVVASDSGRDDFMKLVNLVVKMPRADC
jgi:hypothetical protein